MTQLVKILCFVVFLVGFWALIGSINVWRKFSRREAQGCLTVSVPMIAVPILIIGILLQVGFLEESLSDLILKTVYWTMLISGCGLCGWGCVATKDTKTPVEKKRGKQLVLLGAVIAIAPLLVWWLLKPIN